MHVNGLGEPLWLRSTMSEALRGVLPGLVVAMLVLAPLSTARAFELWSSETGDRYCDLDTSIKWTTLLSHAPENPLLYPERWSSTSLSRLRATLKIRPVEWLGIGVAYEQRARLVSEGAGAAGGLWVFMDSGDAPYRIRQIDEPLVEIGDSFSYRHELDRAYSAVSLGDAQITIGRQAIGWGRGVLFGAVDIFAPFSPLESDREWRRGIDAVRATIPLTDLISVDAVAALGESLDSSSFVGRVNACIGNVDGEIIFGKCYEDYLYAVTASLPVFDAEAHGEFAVFRTPDAYPGGGDLGCEDCVVKAVVGGSYSLDVGDGLYLMSEYHYSGFGVDRITDLNTHLLEPGVFERYMRGDVQVLGKHAVALQATYGLGGTLSASCSWIAAPDGSGVIDPSTTWVFSDNVSLLASAYFPYGAPPDGMTLKSEYGGTPAGGLVQISFYY
jgi:hypothetical protein